MSEHSTFDICVEPIELYKLLKISNMVGGSSEAKTIISEGHVLVNNKVADKKRKKVRRGDVIQYNGKVIEIAYNPNNKSPEFINTVKLANKSTKQKKIAKNKARTISSEKINKSSN